MFFPEKLPHDFEYNYDICFEELNYKIDEETTINALLFKADTSKGLIYYLHGNAGSLNGWGNVAYQFVDLGYDVLITDYRGFGKSSGKISEAALLSDAGFIYHIIKDQYAEKNIVIYGRSLGTGLAAFIAAENKPKLIILESPYYSVIDLAKNLYPWLPSFLVRYPVRTNEYLKKVNCPVYLFHGTNDRIVKYGSSERLKELNQNIKLFTIQGGGHNNLEMFEEYHINLKRILE